MSPWILMSLGFVFVIAGCLLPLLMVLEILAAGFTVSFAAYLSSFAGLLMALCGAVRRRRLSDASNGETSRLRAGGLNTRS